MIKVVLLDIDGTLLDTTEFILGAFEYTLRTHALPIRRRGELVPIVSTLSLEESYRLLAPSSPFEILQRTHLAYQLKHLHLASAFPYTKEVLTTLRQAGIKLAAITNRSKALSLKTLKYAGIAPVMDLIIAREDVAHVKPHPESLLKAVTFFQVDRADVLLVGDTIVDIQAGKNAQVRTVGVTYGFGGRAIMKSNPDFLINKIEELITLVRE